MELPRRIVDLHTHLFNARYIPLASVIGDAMNKPDNALANGVAALLEELTGSSYKDQNRLFADVHFLSQSAKDEDRIDQIWKITQHELISASGSMNAVTKGINTLGALSFSSPEFDLLRTNKISAIVQNLSDIDYAAEGFEEEGAPAPVLPVDLPLDVPLGVPVDLTLDLALNVPQDEFREFGIHLPFSGFLKRSEQAVKKALRAVTAAMDPEAWGERENYVEFFFSMLNSEEEMLKKLIDGYGPDLPKIQFVHFMMDMQMAYEGHKSPRYPFFPEQVEKMEKLHRNNPAKVFGFSAFDPRRDGDWRARAKDALSRGFIGFKFYPPLGYKPSGDKTDVQEVTNAFFDFCVDSDIPVFTHCTPQGFQTHLKEGGNAHPNGWKTVLETPRWSQLRLCLGHSGGARIENNGFTSPGWMAASDEEWASPNNYARIVTELCTTFPNVYCEVANMSILFSPNSVPSFIANLERARSAARDAERPFDLMKKLAYGTDWHMPDMVDNTRRYFEVFLSIMNRPEYFEFIDNFFWENALRYMKVPK